MNELRMTAARNSDQLADSRHVLISGGTVISQEFANIRLVEVRDLSVSTGWKPQLLE